jgi:hypothetical protein
VRAGHAPFSVLLAAVLSSEQPGLYARNADQGLNTPIVSCGRIESCDKGACLGAAVRLVALHNSAALGVLNCVVMHVVTRHAHSREN